MTRTYQTTPKFLCFRPRQTRVVRVEGERTHLCFQVVTQINCPHNWSFLCLFLFIYICFSVCGATRNIIYFSYLWCDEKHKLFLAHYPFYFLIALYFLEWYGRNAGVGSGPPSYSHRKGWSLIRYFVLNWWQEGEEGGGGCWLAAYSQLLFVICLIMLY